MIDIVWHLTVGRFLMFIGALSLAVATLSAAHAISADYFVAVSFAAMCYVLARMVENG